MAMKRMESWYRRWCVHVVLGVMIACAFATRFGWMGDSMAMLIVGVVILWNYAFMMRDRRIRAEDAARERRAELERSDG